MVVSYLGQAKHANCNQILGQVADQNCIAIPESECFDWRNKKNESMPFTSQPDSDQNVSKIIFFPWKKLPSSFQ